MLTAEEQASILKKAKAMRTNEVLRRNAVEKGEMSPRRFRELKQQDEEEMQELLKEIG